MIRQSNFLSGFVFVVLALGFGLGATDFRFGTPANMGAGFLPLCLAVLLGLLGIAIIVQAAIKSSETVEWGSMRPFAVAVVSIVVFALGMRPLGFAAASFVTVLVASFAGPSISWVQRLLPAIVLSALASVVFIELLALPIPIWPAMLG